MPRKRNHADLEYQAPKPTIDQLLDVGKDFNRVSTDFLRVDVATALTFSGIALQTDDAVKRQRNRRAARRAYDTIRRFAKHVTLASDDAQMLASDLARLKSELQTLGEVF